MAVFVSVGLLCLGSGCTYAQEESLPPLRVAVVCMTDAECKATLEQLGFLKERFTLRFLDYEVDGRMNVPEFPFGQRPTAEHEIVIYKPSVLGRDPARLITEFGHFLDSEKPEFVLVMGNAGALDERMRVGDIVISEMSIRQFADLDDVRMRPDEVGPGIPIFSDSLLSDKVFEIASAIPPSEFKRRDNGAVQIFRGSSATINFFASEEDKEEFGRHGLGVVEMEDGNLLMVCKQKGIPMSVIRPISDQKAQDLEYVIRKTGQYMLDMDYAFLAKIFTHRLQGRGFVAVDRSGRRDRYQWYLDPLNREIWDDMPRDMMEDIVRDSRAAAEKFKGKGHWIRPDKNGGKQWFGELDPSQKRAAIERFIYRENMFRSAENGAIVLRHLVGQAQAFRQSLLQKKKARLGILFLDLAHFHHENFEMALLRTLRSSHFDHVFIVPRLTQEARWQTTDDGGTAAYERLIRLVSPQNPNFLPYKDVVHIPDNADFYKGISELGDDAAIASILELLADDTAMDVFHLFWRDEVGTQKQRIHALVQDAYVTIVDLGGNTRDSDFKFRRDLGENLDPHRGPVTRVRYVKAQSDTNTIVLLPPDPVRKSGTQGHRRTTKTAACPMTDRKRVSSLQKNTPPDCTASPSS